MKYRRYIYLFPILSFALLLNTSSCTKAVHNQLSGAWLLNITTKDIGTVRTVMTFEIEDSTFYAHTPENADRKILGFGKSFLGRIFTKTFKNGSLLTVQKGSYKDSAGIIIFKGILVSAIGNSYIRGSVTNGVITAVLKDGRNEVSGSISGIKNITTLPLENYVQLTAQALTIARQNIYDPHIVTSEKWKDFEHDITALSSKANDDLEMVFGFYYYASKLAVSHFAFLRPGETSAQADSNERFMSVEMNPGETAYLKISSFAGDAPEMDSMITAIEQAKSKKLIIDLRDNSGGNIAPALALGAYLVDTPLYCGVLLTQKWFLNHDKAPAISAYTALPTFTKANYDLLISGIHTQEGLSLKVIPTQPHYQGKIYVLTNKNTASTCEPLVYAFKQYKIATIIGEKTAGAMLNGETFDVGKGFKLFIPTADYYTSDGYRIDQKGVMPDISIASDSALFYALNH